MAKIITIDKWTKEMWLYYFKVLGKFKATKEESERIIRVMEKK